MKSSRLRRFRPPALLLGAVLLCAAVPAGSQPAPPSADAGGEGAGAPADVSARDLEAVARALEDEQARSELVAQLRALAEARSRTEAGTADPGVGGALIEALSEGIAAVGVRLDAISGELARPAATLEWLRRQVSEPELRAFWTRTGTIGLAVALAGGLAGALLGVLLRRPRRALEQRAPRTRWRRVAPLLAHALLELVPVLAIAAAALLALAIAAPEPRVRLVLLAAIQAVVAVRGLTVLTRMILAPLASGLRVPPLADANAAYAFVWTVRLLRVLLYGLFVVQTAGLLGASPAGRAGVANGVGLILAMLLVILVLQSRERVAAAIRGSSDRPATRAGRALRTARRALADSWHVLASLYLLAAFGVWMLDIEGGFLFLLQGTLGTIGALLGGTLLARLARRGVERLFRVSEELHQRYPELEGRANRYLPIARGIATMFVAVLATLAALQTWRIDAVFLVTHPASRSVITGLARIGLVIVIALVAWEAAQLFVARLLGDGGEPEPGRRQRARTLLPLAQSAMLVVIVTFATMTILSELGMNIGPLIAGAGIVGLAIGFGAQTLVKDVITGVFILFEDAVSVGDLVEVAGHKGVVEAVNIRSIRHRDLSGVVHTVPFSVVDVVRNFSKDFSYYLTDVGVAYRENVDECVEIMREVVEEMRADPRWGPVILEPLDVMGVESFGDSAVLIRVRIKTLPREQFPTGREFNWRLKHAFDARGIEIPFPHRTLYFGVDKDGTAPPGRLRLAPDSRSATDAPSATAAAGSTGDPSGDGRDPTGPAMADGMSEADAARAEAPSIEAAGAPAEAPSIEADATRAAAPSDARPSRSTPPPDA